MNKSFNYFYIICKYKNYNSKLVRYSSKAHKLNKIIRCLLTQLERTKKGMFRNLKNKVTSKKDSAYNAS